MGWRKNVDQLTRYFCVMAPFNKVEIAARKMTRLDDRTKNVGVLCLSTPDRHLK